MHTIPITYFSEFSPTDVPNGFNWIDFSDPSTVSLSGIKISATQDKSGSPEDYSVSQPVDLSRPEISVGALNGLDVARFDLTQQSLSSNSFSIGFDTTTFVIFTYREQVATFSQFLAGMVGELEDEIIALNVSNVTDQVRFSAFPPDSIIDGAALVNNQSYQLSHTYNQTGNFQEGFLNGVSQGTTTTSIITQNLYTILGNHPLAPRPWIGDIGEVIQYKGVVSVANRIRLQNYFSKKWGVPTV